MPYGFQQACAETVEEAVSVLNNALRTARRHGVDVRLSLAYSDEEQWVKAAIELPEDEDEEDLLS